MLSKRNDFPEDDSMESEHDMSDSDSEFDNEEILKPLKPKLDLIIEDTKS